MMRLNIRGYTEVKMQFQLLRIHHQSGSEPDNLVDMLIDQTVQPLGGSTQRRFELFFSIPDTGRMNIVDNSRYYYGLFASASASFIHNVAEIHGISIPISIKEKETMQDKKFTGKPSSSQKKTFTVQGGHNTLVVHLCDHTWVSVYAEDKEMMRETSPEPIIGFSVSPGKYTIWTDGNIESLTSEFHEPVPSP